MSLLIRSSLSSRPLWSSFIRMSATKRTSQSWVNWVRAASAQFLRRDIGLMAKYTRLRRLSWRAETNRKIGAFTAKSNTCPSSIISTLCATTKLGSKSKQTLQSCKIFQATTATRRIRRLKRNKCAVNLTRTTPRRPNHNLRKVRKLSQRKERLCHCQKSKMMTLNTTKRSTTTRRRSRRRCKKFHPAESLRVTPSLRCRLSRSMWARW